jgi:hypothetical protein
MTIQEVQVRRTKGWWSTKKAARPTKGGTHSASAWYEPPRVRALNLGLRRLPYGQSALAHL